MWGDKQAGKGCLRQWGMQAACSDGLAHKLVTECKMYENLKEGVRAVGGSYESLPHAHLWCYMPWPPQATLRINQAHPTCEAGAFSLACTPQCAADAGPQAAFSPCGTGGNSTVSLEKVTR
eukprot:scaffold5614_cov15-Tisochrysis_lutea.AAC.1